MSDSDGSKTQLSPEVKELGQRLYQRALVRREEESITDPNGNPIGWLLDTRAALMEGELFQEVGSVVARRLRDRGIFQIAGYGFGAYPLVCAILASAETRHFKGGMIRRHRKAYGRKRLVEGALEPEMPIVLVDDILNSGRSAEEGIRKLRREHFEVAGLFTLFHFAWGKGKKKIEARGLWVDTLLDLQLQPDETNSDKPVYSDSTPNRPT